MQVDWQLSACLLCCSFVKVGAMVFLCHDVNDIFMEGAKMARYAEHMAGCLLRYLRCSCCPGLHLAHLTTSQSYVIRSSLL